MANLTKKQILLSSVAVIFEWYDFCLYIYLAHLLTMFFFPDPTSAKSGIYYYLVFATGYIVRPFGGLFFGRLADRCGRKKSLLLAIKLLMFASFAISVLPTYAKIGTLAPLGLLLLRAIQGFAMGGEYTGVLTLMFENSNPSYQGRHLSMIGLSSITGQLISAALFYLLIAYVPHPWLNVWGWRLCFLFGATILIAIYFIQNHLPESQSFERLKNTKKPISISLLVIAKYYFKPFFAAFMTMAALSATYACLFIFVPNHMLQAPLSRSGYHWMIVLGIALQYPAYYVGGVLSDKYGSFKAVLFTFIAVSVLIMPAMLWLRTDHTGLDYLFLVLLVIVPTMPVLVYINSIFPTPCRATLVFLSYNLANAIFCGLMPVASLWLYDQAHNLHVIIITMIVLQLLAIAAMYIAKKNYDDYAVV